MKYFNPRMTHSYVAYQCSTVTIQQYMLIDKCEVAKLFTNMKSIQFNDSPRKTLRDKSRTYSVSLVDHYYHQFQLNLPNMNYLFGEVDYS